MPKVPDTSNDGLYLFKSYDGFIITDYPHNQGVLTVVLLVGIVILKKIFFYYNDIDFIPISLHLAALTNLATFAIDFYGKAISNMLGNNYYSETGSKIISLRS